ncbi:hypothetical protein AJ80_02034 [Polytolypa hystricis UAMH7299]|uniref:Fatty acid hydroxylase domain-containing protein n=1 Tax=Polytolypa hystricis (strain UAMH7299) TaxID=1447883 RepID=A0A2B7YSX4_POLH7|nr:hypothetical protein AJ80_02034 [Polytolypa hystricis UAMH7299]
MDIVLDLFETLIGDHVYSRILPAQLVYSNAQSSSNGSAIGGLSCHYEPATKFFSITPSQAACMSAWPRENIYRQSINLFLIPWIFGLAVYFIFASLSYIFIFDKEMKNHPKYLKNQVWLEIRQATIAMPGMSLLMLPLVLGEVRGYSKMYDTSADGPGRWYDIAQFPLFLLFTDFCIYWIHRGLHHPSIYKTLHKSHHKWIIPTPYAAYAFHPADGFAQALPYYIFPFLFPLQKLAYIFFFVFVNFWSILIHDGEYMADNPIINGAACHTLHHWHFRCNYGQYSTLWDRVWGSYKRPDEELFARELKKSHAAWEKQSREVEVVVGEVEGVDDRTYEGKKDI